MAKQPEEMLATAAYIQGWQTHNLQVEHDHSVVKDRREVCDQMFQVGYIGKSDQCFCDSTCVLYLEVGSTFSVKYG